MGTNFEENQKKNSTTIRNIYNYTMGVLWIAVGVFFLGAEKFGFDISLQNTVVEVFFGSIAVLYGSFRIYRGFKSFK